MFIYPIYNHNWRNISTICIYRGADKSLARTGRKQTTATEGAEVKNEWIYISKPLYAFMDSEKFIFTINFFPPLLFILRENPAILSMR